MTDNTSSASGKPSGFAAELTDNQRRLLDQMADKIVQLRMTAPALLFLESVRPMNYVGSQVMVFFSPLVRGFFGLPEWDELRLVLERRQSIGYFLDLLEEKEGIFLTEEKIKREARRAEKIACKAKKKNKLI